MNKVYVDVVKDDSDSDKNSPLRQGYDDKPLDMEHLIWRERGYGR